MQLNLAILVVFLHQTKSMLIDCMSNSTNN